MWSTQFTAGDAWTITDPTGLDADVGAAPNLFTAGGTDAEGVEPLPAASPLTVQMGGFAPGFNETNDQTREDLTTPGSLRYAGTAGWVDGAGNGAWAVSVRCAEIEGATARVWAGNGIVANSEPRAELAETRVKFQAMLSALVRP